MKAGKSLQEMAAELDRQAKSKRDFVASTQKLSMQPDGSTLLIHGNGELKAAFEQSSQTGIGDFAINRHCHQQIGDRLGIPKKYYDRMLSESPQLLATNVNHWFQQTPEERMVRTLDGKARAFLSRRYRPLDNYDLANAVFEKLIAAECRVETAELTELRMYIQAISFKVEGEVKKGDVVRAGVVISNSEVGAGAVRIEPLILRLVCMNGMIAADHSLRKYHVGRVSKGFEFDGAAEFFRDETRQQDDKAFYMKVQDLVKAALEQVTFDKILESMRAAADRQIESADLQKVAEVTQQQFRLTDTERGSVLKHLIQGGDLSQYGLANAITATANDHEDYDRAVDLERFGGQVIELPQKDWKLISTAAA